MLGSALKGGARSPKRRASGFFGGGQSKSCDEAQTGDHRRQNSWQQPRRCARGIGRGPRNDYRAQKLSASPWEGGVEARPTSRGIEAGGACGFTACGLLLE